MATTLSQLIAQASSVNTLYDLFARDNFGVYAAASYCELDGATDDYAALYALINTTINGADAEIWFKDGTCYLASSISIPSNIKLKFIEGGMLKPASGKTITGVNGKIDAGLHQIFDLSLGGSVAGTWDVPCMYPEWFGAKGDGVTDDTTYINYAVSALDSNGGGTLKFSAKTYIVTAPINLRSHVTYIGDGFNTIVKQKASATADNIFGEASPSSAVSNVTISSLKVDGNSGSSTHPADDANGNGIRFNQVTYGLITNCYITGTKNNGISIYNTSSDNIIQNNIIVDNGATSGLPATYSRNGVFIEFGSSRNKVLFNRISSNADCGIWSGAQGADNEDNVIEGNYVSSNSSDGIWIGDGSGSSNHKRTKIINNNVGSNTSVGIRLNHAASGSILDTVISNNNVVSNGGGGIYVQSGSSRTVVACNNSLSNTGDGIGTGASSADTLIVSNIALSNSVSQLGLLGTRDVEIGNVVDTTGLIRSTQRIQSEHSMKVSVASGSNSELILAQAGVVDWTIRNAATSGKLAAYDGTVSIMELDNTPSAEDTALLLYVNDGGSFALRQVSMGADDSGGGGYRLLRVAN